MKRGNCGKFSPRRPHRRTGGSKYGAASDYTKQSAPATYRSGDRQKKFPSQSRGTAVNQGIAAAPASGPRRTAFAPRTEERSEFRPRGFTRGAGFADRSPVLGRSTSRPAGCRRWRRSSTTTMMMMDDQQDTERRMYSAPVQRRLRCIPWRNTRRPISHALPRT